MKARVRHLFVAAGLIAVFGAHVARATGPLPYWSYSYQGIDVMTPEDGAHARTLAHNVHRVEVAVQRLLDANSTMPLPPTHIYSLHHPTYVRLAPPNRVDSSYNVRLYVPFEFVVRDGENYALMDAGEPDQSAGAYFGLAGSLLVRQKIRYPAWFSTGFARLISPAHISGSQVIVGRTDPWLAKVLLSRKLRFIPTRELLRMNPEDEALQKDLGTQEYAAECWLLVHAITVEGRHKSEFARYLQLLDEGKPSADAFAGSFQATYEDLDKMLKDILAQNTIRTLSIEVPDEADTEQPRQLTSAEADERIIKVAEALQGGPPLQSDRSDQPALQPLTALHTQALVKKGP